METKKTSVILSLSIKMIIIAIVSFLIGIFLFRDVMAYAKGLAFGTLFSILKLKLMEKTIEKSLKKDAKMAKLYVNSQYIIRYILTALVLLIGILEPSINPVGVIIGLISMKFAAYWQGSLLKPVPKDGSVQFLEWEDDEEESDF